MIAGGVLLVIGGRAALDASTTTPNFWYVGVSMFVLGAGVGMTDAEPRARRAEHRRR